MNPRLKAFKVDLLTGLCISTNVFYKVLGNVNESSVENYHHALVKHHADDNFDGTLFIVFNSLLHPACKSVPNIWSL